MNREVIVNVLEAGETPRDRRAGAEMTSAPSLPFALQRNRPIRPIRSRAAPAAMALQRAKAALGSSAA